MLLKNRVLYALICMFIVAPLSGMRTQQMTKEQLRQDLQAAENNCRTKWDELGNTPEMKEWIIAQNNPAKSADAHKKLCDTEKFTEYSAAQLKVDRLTADFHDK